MPDYISVAKINDIPPGSARLVEVQGIEIALFNIGGIFHAVDNSCSHVGGPLCEGELNGAEVTCPWHGAVFEVTTGRAVGPPAMEPVTCYNVRVAGDEIQIEI